MCRLLLIAFFLILITLRALRVVAVRLYYPVDYRKDLRGLRNSYWTDRSRCRAVDTLRPVVGNRCKAVDTRCWGFRSYFLAGCSRCKVGYSRY